MFMTLLAKELREQSRTFRLWILLAAMVIFGLFSALTAKYLPALLTSLPGVPEGMSALMPAPRIEEAFLQFVKNLGQLGLILVVVLNMGSMAQEIERGTAAMLLTKPVRRSSVVLAKWLAAVIAMAAGLTASAIGCAFYSLVLFAPFNPGNFISLVGLTGVYLLFYLTLTLLTSTLARTQAAAAAAAFGALLLAGIIDVLPFIGRYLPGELVSWAGSIAGGMPISNLPALLVSLVLTGVFLAAAMIVFSRKEL